MRSALIVAMLLLGAVRPLNAQTNDLTVPRSIAETFLTGLAQGSVAPAYDALFKGSSVPTDKPQAVDTIKRQTEAMLPAFGKALSFELIDSKTYGAHVARLTYIQSLEKHALIWRFWFYKPTDTWWVASVFYSDQFQGLRD
jgi:hypothetical protein